jgi:Ca2+-binding RTX toxin-like protein
LQTLLRRPLRLLPLLFLVGLATAGAASAATVSASGTTVTFNAVPGETNDVFVSQGGGTFTISDSNNDVTADTSATDAGCTQDATDTVSCPDTTTLITANLGDGDDDLGSSSSVTIPEAINGGDGNDSCLDGGTGADVIHGDAGNDCIFGDPGGPSTPGSGDQLFGDAGDDSIMAGRGDDVANGGDGDDYVNGGPGADAVNGDAGADVLQGGPGFNTQTGFIDNGDVISGGPGSDQFWYRQDRINDQTTDLSISLDDVANDGLAGENDNVRSDVESISYPNNSTAASTATNPGTWTGSADQNVIQATAGNNTINPGDGNDFVYAGGGDDTINANDGFADRIDCGSGTDTANVDEFDVVDGCETVNRTTRGSLATEDHPPTVAFTAPASGAKMSTTTPNVLSVTATDDKGISKVVFLAGERVICTITAAPYNCAYSPTDADVGHAIITAVAFDTSQQTASALRTVSVPRFKPAKVSSKTTPGRDTKAPFTFKTTGSVTLPPGVTAALGCNGVASVIFKAGGKTISSRNANVSKTCKFSRKVTFRIPRRLHPKTLKVEVKFRGNAVLTARSASSKHVKVT